MYILKGRRLWFLACIAIAAALPLVGSGQPGGAEDYYYAQGRKIPVTVARNQIGLVMRTDVPAQKVRPFAEQFKLNLGRELTGGYYVPTLPEQRDRAGLVKFVREVRAGGIRDGLLKNAGLIVTVGKETAPRVVTDEFIALFKPEITRARVDELNKKNRVQVVSQDRFVKNQYLMRVTEAAVVDALVMANRYQEGQLCVFAQPNFYQIFDLMETIPNDSLFASQWHHRNTGASGGTVDADADTSLAWDLTTGSPNVLIAVADAGVDLGHEDLAPNVFVNADEVAGNGVDDDVNGFVDDVNGWDFFDDDNDPNPAVGLDNHGTAVAGVAAARGNNGLGVSGACPNGRFMSMKIFRGAGFATSMGVASAFGYAQMMGSRPGFRGISNNSWGLSDPAGVADSVIVTAIDNAAAGGLLIFFAGGNSSSSDYCIAGFPSLENVIAVSSSSNLDRKVIGHSFGNCIDLLAPTRWSPNDPSPTGTLAITTTDRTGTNGYNNANPICIGGLTDPPSLNYTNCFSGTSSATPLTAGVAGLVLSVNPALTRVQVQRLLQDTADKIEPSVGLYADATGFSSPAAGIATHSWGRVNAFEAVRIAAPVAQGGKDGVDVFLRDNRLDWGNTGQPSNTTFEPVRGFIPHWESVDIRVDAPPFAPAPTTPAAFEAFVSENATSGVTNRVYVRVRNRGPVTANSVTVKLHWAFAGLGLPALPPDFWTAFPSDSSDTSQWHPLGVQMITNLAYSGSSVAGCPGRPAPACGGGTDVAQVGQFDFPGPPVDPMKPDPNHFCLMAVVDSPQDTVSGASKASFVVDDITPRDNNVTHRNIRVEDTGGSSDFTERFHVNNPTRTSIQAVIRLAAPRGWKVSLDRFEIDRPFRLRPHEQVLVTMKVTLPKPRLSGVVVVTQEQVTDQRSRNVMGGMSYQFGPVKR